ncbi:MAG: hypothetical protein QXX41_07165 [Nitrososphaerota archaeon]
MSERKLYIIIEEYDANEESEKIFERRGWRSVNDQSTPLPGKKQIRKVQHDTPLIRLEIEEYEYGGEG